MDAENSTNFTTLAVGYGITGFSAAVGAVYAAVNAENIKHITTTAVGYGVTNLTSTAGSVYSAINLDNIKNLTATAVSYAPVINLTSTAGSVYSAINLDNIKNLTTTAVSYAPVINLTSTGETVYAAMNAENIKNMSTAVYASLDVKNIAISPTGVAIGVVAAPALAYCGFAAVGLSMVGPTAGGLFATSMGPALASTSWMAMAQAAAMTTSTYVGAAKVGAVFGGAIGGLLSNNVTKN